ncbi:uncharacterized protein LOC117381593 [Periophthalmus magnuspinnatus]|uniref:uncharacterized protein LOC117381593 n=1 Tax=Periophthalmus magnuspinnatus TaxID=409849 RepID=UPI0024366856|nr:uncharacterized protein LOC117381593 [Periophthalmus magnuspinnatus]
MPIERVRGPVRTTNNDKKIKRGLCGVGQCTGCTSLGGICQRKSLVCQGRYLNAKCSGYTNLKCCVPDVLIREGPTKEDRVTIIKGIVVGVAKYDQMIKGVPDKIGNNCSSLGGTCQPPSLICQGRYMNGKCPGHRTLKCCVPDGAWSVLCAGHNNNRVRACDAYGCGAFNSRRGAKLHKAVDIVCDDLGVIQAPFSGNVSGPVSYTDPKGNQYEGVKLIGKGKARTSPWRQAHTSLLHCVKLLNVRPYRYTGSVTRGGAVGYVLPLQDRFSGITSHVKVQMCDGSDPAALL